MLLSDWRYAFILNRFELFLLVKHVVHAAVRFVQIVCEEVVRSYQLYEEIVWRIVTQRLMHVFELFRGEELDNMQSYGSKSGLI